jgi:hypothetical protein
MLARKRQYWSRCGNEKEDKEQERSGESVCSMEKLDRE